MAANAVTRNDACLNYFIAYNIYIHTSLLFIYYNAISKKKNCFSLCCALLKCTWQSERFPLPRYILIEYSVMIFVSLCVGIIAVFFINFYYKTHKTSEFFRKQNIPYLRPLFPLWSTISLMLKYGTMRDFAIAYYNKFPNDKYFLQGEIGRAARLIIPNYFFLFDLQIFRCILVAIDANIFRPRSRIHSHDRGQRFRPFHRSPNFYGSEIEWFVWQLLAIFEWS